MLVSLPSDALEQIVNHIEDYSDVLNVALSHKILYSVAVPQHLHYRDLRTRLHNLALWSQLSRPDDLRADRIRSLTILPDNHFDFYEVDTYDLRERLPLELTPSEPRPFHSDLNPEACLKSEASLVSALRRMSRLQRFRWYRLHVTQPLLQEGMNDLWSTLQGFGTVKELDIFDGRFAEFQGSPIAISDTFLRFSSLTTLKLRSFACRESINPEIPLQLEQMLLTNCPDLEVLLLELDLDEQMDGTASINRLLRDARWPNLRVLHLRGVNCRVPELTQFLLAHPKLEELALAQMMPGHAWTRLELPSDALPNLHHLECSSAQAAALLKNSESSIRRLQTLLGIEVHDTIVDSEYFTWDDDWEDEDHEDENEESSSPWKALLLEGLKAQHSITRLGVASIRTSQEVETLAVVAPQVRDIHIPPEAHFKLNDTEWHRLYSLFPALEVIRGVEVIWFDPYMESLTTEAEEKANIQVQALARSCPRLRLILIGRRTRKAVIIRDSGESGSGVGVRWVVRKWYECEDTYVKDGEQVYGP